MPARTRTPRHTTPERAGVVNKAIISDATPSTDNTANSVQDRIRQWQAQGAAETLAPDTLSVIVDPDFEVDRGLGKLQQEEQEDKENLRRRSHGSTNRWVDRDSRAWVRQVRSKSTPRKRLVSDEHWKSDRSQPDLDHKKAPAPNPTLDLSPAESKSASSRPAEERGERRRRRKGARRLESSDVDDDIRVYATPPVSRRQSAEDLHGRVFVGDGTQLPSDSHTHKNMTASLVEDNQLSDQSPNLEDDDGRRRRRSKYAETLGRMPAPDSSDLEGGLSIARPSRRGLFSKTRDMFARHEQQVSTNGRVPSIKAWLDEQPDLLVRDEKFSNAVLPPVVARPRKENITREPSIVEDANKIWDSVVQSPPKKPVFRNPKREENQKQESLVHERRVQPFDVPEGPGWKSPSQIDDEGQQTKYLLGISRANATKHRQASGSRRDLTSPVPAKPTTSKSNRAAQIISENPEAGLQDHFKQTSEDVPVVSPHRTSPTDVTPLQDNDPDEVGICGVQRKLTTHDDLISMLSRSKTRQGKSVGRRMVIDKESITAVLDDVASEEVKYVRELRTLVDGVIPVILQAALSRSDSADTAQFFSPIATAGDTNLAKPIIEMGVALQRLKSAHSRLPTNDVNGLLSWAQFSQRAYTDYIDAWRLGFQDVVVNLAPIHHDDLQANTGMARDASGDVVDSAGNKVDVAYLLKRPLVRVKKMSKSFMDLDQLLQSLRSKKVADEFSKLTLRARERHQAEKARVEDESAANIDASKARDLRTLAAITGVTVGRQKSVTARDCFNMTLYHSSGQRIDNRVEMLFRETDDRESANRDVLICEVENTGKWLLFPPLESSQVSARKGEDPLDLIIMVRGRKAGQEWHELLALKADDQETVVDWITIVGSNPLPPKLNRSPSFAKHLNASKETGPEDTETTRRIVSEGSSLMRKLEVPIGEPSVVGGGSESGSWSSQTSSHISKPVQRLNLGGGLHASNVKRQPPAFQGRQQRPKSSDATTSSGQSTVSSESIRTPSSLYPLPLRPSPKPATQSPSNGVQQVIQLNQSAHTSFSKLQEKPQDAVSHMVRDPPSTDRSEEFSKLVLAPSQDKQALQDQHLDQSLPATTQRPRLGRTTSTTPNQNLPSIPKIRNEGSSRTDCPPLPLTEDIPAPPIHSIRPRDISPKIRSHREQTAEPVPPVPPPHRHSIGAPPPSAKPVMEAPKSHSVSPSFDRQTKRRASSPLKHEYAPSLSSASSLDSESDGFSGCSSETSDEFSSEANDQVTPLVTVGDHPMPRLASDRQKTWPTATTTGTRTLAPSDSASQGPYRSVPAASAVPGARIAKTIAMVCSWSDRGGWDPIDTNECSIVVSPGLIEAFEMSAAHSRTINEETSKNSSSQDTPSVVQPLVALELTPLVPLRRGTALDISIRSPPTVNSRITASNNVMFRSRNAAECEALYAMINWARINNLTYIALERARPKVQPSVTFAMDNVQHSRSKSGSWFSFEGNQRKSSYRASSAPAPSAPSIGGATDAGVGNVAGAFLKRFSVNSPFNINKSSLLHKNVRQGTNSSLYSSSSATRSSGANTPAASQLGWTPGKDGPNVPATSAEAANGGGMVNNMKIRLYRREDMTKWINMGAARLTVMPPPPSSGVAAATQLTDASTRRSSAVIGLPEHGFGTPRMPSSTHSPHQIHHDGREKRIVVTGSKKTDVVFIDRVLGESCFERIMQSGIAVKVWEEDDRIADRGGVVGGRAKTYMFQFPGTKEAAWVFNLVGTYRF